VPDSAGAIFALDSRMPMVTLALRQTLNVGEGIELDSYVPVTLADQVTRAAPALRIQWIQSPLLTFSGAYLRTHQYAQSLRNPESVVDHVFPADVTIGSESTPIPVAEADQGLVAADWRSIAVGGNGRLGIASQEPSEREATSAALRECVRAGGTDCSIRVVGPYLVTRK